MFKPNNEYQKALAKIESWTLHPQSAETHVDEKIFGGAVSDRVFFIKTLAVPDEPNGTIDVTLEFNPETTHAKNIGDVVTYMEDIGSGKLLKHRDQLREALEDVKRERDTWKDEAMLKATEAEAFMIQRNQLREALNDVVKELDRLEPDPINQQWKGSPMRAKAIKAIHD